MPPKLKPPKTRPLVQTGKPPPTPPPRSDRRWETAAPLSLGCLVGIALLKFGNPVILDRYVEAPASSVEFLFNPWPITWGYALLLIAGGLSLAAARPAVAVPKWLLFLPLVWLVWQVISSFGSIDRRLTAATLRHFFACAGCYYLGLFALRQGVQRLAFWTPILAAFLWVLWIGFEQHYGGLEATRKMFYQQPNWQEYPPEYIQRIASNRIFATLVYPNAFAGAILLLLPPLLAATWLAARRLTVPSRGVIAGVLAYAALACLFWSGSKAGWLIALLAGVIVLLHQPLPRAVRWGIIAAVLIVGLVGFAIKFAPYFERGATSVAARFIYWQAALRTFQAHPILGTGPGTFSHAYAKIKPEGAEMARLTHNDYLEQASDSGVIGFLSYSGFILGALGFLYRRYGRSPAAPIAFAAWIGLVNWAAQSAVEFCLYIPALAWPAFLILGALLGTPVLLNSVSSTPESGPSSAAKPASAPSQ